MRPSAKSQIHYPMNQRDVIKCRIHLSEVSCLTNQGIILIKSIPSKGYYQSITIKGWILPSSTLPSQPVLVNRIKYSDEAYFPLTQEVNRQNNRLWLKEKPSEDYNTHYMTRRFQFLCKFFNQGLWDVFFSSKINKHILPRYAQ